MPQPGQAWQAAVFEAIITFGLVLMILNLANGPKLNGPFVPLAVGAYILAWGTMGGPYEGASMNPARSFGPDVAIGNLSTWWVYLVGPWQAPSSRSGSRTCCVARPRRRRPPRPRAHRSAAAPNTPAAGAAGCGANVVGGQARG
jgi:hypothetical protein